MDDENDCGDNEEDGEDFRSSSSLSNFKLDP
jgi:hypothetical protein